MLSDHIFRAYDIRGIADKDFDEEGARKIGLGYATYLQKIAPAPLKIAVGRDGREHSEKYQKAFIDGVLSCGIDVVDIGLATSPLLNFSVCVGGFSGGVNITASHNPKEFNGFKLQREGAHAIFGEEIQEIRRIIEKGDFALTASRGTLQSRDFQQEWFKKLASLVKISDQPKIVVDCGNGVAGLFAEKFFRLLGAEVIPLFCEVDGNFPNHEANPEVEANLADLKKAVIENNALLGIAFDGDGDRVGIIDANGTHYAADLLLLLLARDLLARHPQATVVYDLKATQVLAEEITRLGGRAIECKTGHSFIEGKMQEEKALLGGEVSGHIFFAEDYYGFDDAFLAAAKILEIVAREKKPLKEHFRNLPATFVTPELKAKITEKAKFAVMEKIITHFVRKYPQQTSIIDGVKINFPEGAWGIVRASNTSPYLTLRFEARSQQKLQEIQEEILTHLHMYPEISAVPAPFVSQ